MGTLKVIGSALYQWEIGRKIRIDASVGNRAVEVQFAHPGDKEALSVTPKEENGIIVAEVPNIMLQSADKLVAFLVEMDENCVETTRHSVFRVVNRPKPADYIYTETEVLNYTYLDNRLKELEGDGLAKAVADYLKENPVQAGATAEEAAQIQQNKTDIEKLTQDKLDASALPEAINEALAQAKESGEFKGNPGEPGYTPVKGIDYFDGQDGKDGYTPQKGIDYFDGKDGKDGQNGSDYVLTEADKQEIAELTAPLVDVPEGGSNQPLTFTGAVNATYDGSEAVTVNIPSGGGGGGCSTYWKKVASVEITAEETSKVYITQDIDGNPLNIDKSHRWQVYTTNANYSANGYVDLQLNKFMKAGTTDSVALRLNTYTNADFIWFGIEPFLDGQLFIKGVHGARSTRNIRQGAEIPTYEACYDGENITQIGVNLKSSTYFKVGTIISVYEEVSA